MFDQTSAAEYAAKLERWLAKHPDDHPVRLELAHVYWLHLAAPNEATSHLDVLTGLEQPSPLARYSRGTLAQSHLDLDRAWKEYAALLREAPKHEKRRDRELALALTPGAARAIDALDGLRPGDTEQFLELFEEIDRNRKAYPAATFEAMLSTRAAIARRLEEDYRSFYAQQGCVQDWVVGELEGYRGPLELARREVDRSFKRDATGASTTLLSCAFRVWNPEPTSGIRRLRTTVEVPAGQSVMRLTIGTQYDARVYVDDQLIWAKDRIDRYPVESPTFALPVGSGQHRIEVRTAIPTERAWVLIRATGQDGTPLAAKADAEQKGSFGLGPNPHAPREAGAEALLETQAWADGFAALRGPVYAPLRSFLALDQALADGDTDRAEELADSLKIESDGFAEAHLLLADFEYRDPTRGKTVSATRQQAELERSLELDASLGRAHLSMLSLRLERGDVAEVVEALEAIPPDTYAPTGEVLLSMLRFEAYRARGSDAQAEQALEKAAAIHPSNCDVLMARRELIRERAQVAAEDRLIEQLTRCSGSLALRASLATQRGRHDEAEALWQEQLERMPDDLEAMEALVELAVAQEHYDEAIDWHKRMLALAPYRALSHVELADLHARQSEPKAAREHVIQAIDRYPHNSRLRKIGERIGIEDDLMRWRIDGKQALAEYRGDVEQGLASEGVAEVLLLDREVSLLYKNGGHRHIVHQMFHVLSDQSIDAHGEFEQPGVELLTMHSIKPDGTIVEPESIPGKEGLSLRGLEIGDVVEIEFVFEGGPEVALPGHIDLGRFRFQSPEVPFHRSELIVVVPAEMEKRLDFEARNKPPGATRQEVDLHDGKFVELTFLARQVPRLGSEPSARSMLDELPSVQVHVPIEIEDWLEQLASALRPAQRSNPELRRLAFELTAQYTNDYDKLDTLWRWVVTEIEDAGDLTTPATVTLAARQGSRLTLLRAMCDAIGLDTQIWLLRDRFGPVIHEHGDPLVETYDTAMIALIEKGKPPLLVGTSAKVIPLGYLSPSYAGGQALRVRIGNDEPEPGYVAVPANPEQYKDSRRWDIEIALDASGSGTVRGSIELRGLEAIIWRDAFDKVDNDRLPEVFISAELSRMLPGASLDLDGVEFINQWELDQPLVMQFSARARGGGVIQGGQLIMLAAAVPIDPVTSYTRLPSRWSGLVMAYASVLEANVRYVLEGATFTDVPVDVKLSGQWGSYTRSVVAGGKGQRELTLSSRSTLVPGIVEPEDYAALARFGGQIQAAEQALLRAR